MILEMFFLGCFWKCLTLPGEFLFVWQWMLLSQDGQTANVCLISRSTAKNMENNNEMLEGSTRDLFDDAGQGLNEFRIPSV